jgi:hypothetical protein
MKRLPLYHIQNLRAANKAHYEKLKSLGTPDTTLTVVICAYALHPVEAAAVHREILTNDAQILEWSRLLCE